MTARITGEVIDAAGRPVPEASVRLAIVEPVESDDELPVGPDFAVLDAEDGAWTRETTTCEDGTFGVTVPSDATNGAFVHAAAERSGAASTEAGGDWFACGTVHGSEAVGNGSWRLRMVHERLGNDTGSVSSGDGSLEWLDLDVWRSVDPNGRGEHVQACVRDRSIAAEDPPSLRHFGSFQKEGALTLVLDERSRRRTVDPPLLAREDQPFAERAATVARFLDGVANAPPYPPLLNYSDEGDPGSSLVGLAKREPPGDGDEGALEADLDAAGNVATLLTSVAGLASDAAGNAGAVLGVADLLVSVAKELDLGPDDGSDALSATRVLGNGESPPTDENRFDTHTGAWSDPVFASLLRGYVDYPPSVTSVEVGVRGLLTANYYTEGNPEYKVEYPETGQKEVYQVDHGHELDPRVRSPLGSDESAGATEVIACEK